MRWIRSLFVPFYFPGNQCHSVTVPNERRNSPSGAVGSCWPLHLALIILSSVAEKWMLRNSAIIVSLSIDLRFTMPKIKTNRVKYPEGWELIEPTLRELEQKMREGSSILELWGFFDLLVDAHYCTTGSDHCYFLPSNDMILVSFLRLNRCIRLCSWERHSRGETCVRSGVAHI